MADGQQSSARRVIVIGPGATGGAIAAELHLHGVPVVVVARGAELDALRTKGLIYHITSGSTSVPLEVVGGPDELELVESDVLVVTTKTQDVEPVLREWAWAPVRTADGSTSSVGQSIPLITVQNGLNTERVALRWFRTVIAGTIFCPGGKEKVGEIINYGPTLRLLLWLGHYSSGARDQELETIAGTLGRAPTLGIQPVDEILPIKAWKLAYNTRNGVEPVFAPSALRDELEARARAEAEVVLRAEGIEPRDPLSGGLSPWSHDVLEGGVVSGHPRLGNSTLQSFVRGAPLETDYLNGEIVLLGRLHGIPTPLSEGLQILTAQAVADNREAGALGDEAIRRLLDRAEAQVS
ncbi:2-dehydropantoate 2-reductase N-terminal domain-containing protein [Gordonia sp. NB41Y]|uniref:ketopantoate reductase family protein n=1 Tax=Gordonia sp. NB41Y TaxID=875808 RepID=UPI0006C5FAAA|nr:2-dehydropantoate 2-reductase N-terminal domain-containing protein [Gordonia sp. NB41Y]KOY49059.1 hypothetical protein ISGA_12680 [Gordonia sp. NB41Y]WLP88449.1 2-dehydropantoate 2-reductase N-terminal domain-containing protein [Gordonia sp. NB41Y]